MLGILYNSNNYLLITYLVYFHGHPVLKRVAVNNFSQWFLLTLEGWEAFLISQENSGQLGCFITLIFIQLVLSQVKGILCTFISPSFRLALGLNRAALSNMVATSHMST